IPLLSLKNLAQHVAAYCGLYSILHVRHIDAEARRRIAIDGQVEVGLPYNPEEPKIFDALDRAQHIDDFIALRFELPEIGAVDLDCELSLDPADGLFHVVRDWLREIPDDAWNLLEIAIHRRNQLVFVLVEN